ncbi:MAG: hypothetical protein ACI9DC_002489 [Gammaproteobacteria bacterium]|jgi:hypothetical protein
MKRPWRALPIALHVASLLAFALSHCVLFAQAHAQSEAIHYGVSSGVDFSRGDFKLNEDTELLYLPTTLRVGSGPWTARTTLAWLTVSGPPGAAISNGVVSTIGGKQSGFGDVVLGLTYSSNFSLLGNNYLDTTMKVKVPTADEKRGLGTGAADYSIELELFRSHGPWTPSAAIGYRVLGDNAGFRLHNALLGSAGMDYRFSPAINAGGLLDWREPASRNSDDALEFVPYLSWKAGGGITLTGYGTVGLADGSPERGIGVQISFRSDRR